MEQGNPRAVLLTGVYGAGKSSVAAEMATVLEERTTPYAALDLDWLSWFDAGSDDESAAFAMLLRNVSDVMGNYRAAGIERFILALSIETREELDGLSQAIGVPLTVIRLELPLEAIEERLRSDVTSGRELDLHRAGVWIENGTGVGLEDDVVRNDRPIRQVALDILDRLKWDGPDEGGVSSEGGGARDPVA